MARILDLRNPNNHKKNNNQKLSDVLEDEELEFKPIEKESPFAEVPEDKQEKIDDYFEEYKDVDPADKLFEQTPNKIDPVRSREGSQRASASYGVDMASPNQDNQGEMEENYLEPTSWTVADVHYELISHTWRKAIIVILVAMAFLTLFWQKSILAAVMFFGLALVTSMHFWREPRYEHHEIHPHGIVIGGRFYHYHDLDSFCIHYHPEGFHELSLKTGRLLNHYIKVPLGNKDPFEIRNALMMYLPEEPHEEGLDDWLRRKLGL